MAAPVQAPMPEGLDVAGDYTIRITAIDPTTGNTVGGVNIGKVVLTAEAGDAGGTVGGTDTGTWLLVPGPGA